jgi:hypothetical protein
MIYRPRGWSEQEETTPFPLTEEYYDCSGIKHVFKITARKASTGHVVTAVETNVESQGYEFNVFSPANEYIALAMLRDKIRRGLAIKYLDDEHGQLVLTHEEMKGTISYDSDTASHGVVVDGRFLSMDRFEKILAQYEGWEFDLKILDY